MTRLPSAEAFFRLDFVEVPPPFYCGSLHCPRPKNWGAILLRTLSIATAMTAGLQRRLFLLYTSDSLGDAADFGLLADGVDNSHGPAMAG